jgi:hypothetical protein|tara:strand:- start:313 stop:414 length:102 start_codon:yes stop_codon:yes gene_type:complete
VAGIKVTINKKNIQGFADLINTGRDIQKQLDDQ